VVRWLAVAAVTGAVILGTLAPATPAATEPGITILSPRAGAGYERGTRVLARFHCGAGAISCRGTVAAGAPLETRYGGPKVFRVTATDAAGRSVTRTVRYSVWTYVNPLAAVTDLQPSRIDMGVDYSGAGPVRAIGRARVLLARDRLAGPEGCWGKTCVPAPGDLIVYRLLDGPLAGRSVYVVENITITVRAGQLVRAGQRLAILHDASPNLEMGWALGRGAWTLAAARGHQCACADPGGWSSIEGRNFNAFMVWLGARSGYPTVVPAGQAMPAGWPRIP
jgi:hypothetical protein